MNTSHRHCVTLFTAITFKTPLMTFDCSRGRCPKYFGDVYTPVHTVAAHSRLRSADHGDLVVPRVRSTCFGCRSFRVCGPTIWNKLPQDLRSTDTREQFKRSYSSVCMDYGMRRISQTLTEGALYKWTTYLLTYLVHQSYSVIIDR